MLCIELFLSSFASLHIFLQVEIPRGLAAHFSCRENCLVYQVSRSTNGTELGDPSMVIASNPDVFGSHKYVLRGPSKCEYILMRVFAFRLFRQQET